MGRTRSRPTRVAGVYRRPLPGFKPGRGVMRVTDRNRPLGLYSLPSGGAHTHPSPRVPSEPAPGESSPPGALLFGGSGARDVVERVGKGARAARDVGPVLGLERGGRHHRGTA